MWTRSASELSAGVVEIGDWDAVDGSASRPKEADPGPTNNISDSPSHNRCEHSPNRRGNITVGRWRGLAKFDTGQEDSEGALLLLVTERELEPARPRFAAGDRSPSSLSLSEPRSIGFVVFSTERLRFVEAMRVFAIAGFFADVDFADVDLAFWAEGLVVAVDLAFGSSLSFADALRNTRKAPVRWRWSVVDFEQLTLLLLQSAQGLNCETTHFRFVSLHRLHRGLYICKLVSGFQEDNSP